jgi:hypothetical protein
MLFYTVFATNALIVLYQARSQVDTLERNWISTAAATIKRRVGGSPRTVLGGGELDQVVPWIA